MADLFQSATATATDYSAKDIEVLEGLEPVRRRPGMYVGGTDERALHHLVAEVLDNAMDEAVAGHATRIDLFLDADNSVTVRDNGRGIPIDPHPKYPDRSALEVILTTLHSGGKFSGKAYKTSGGLHGVGVSVVNALTDRFDVEVARDRKLWGQSYSRGRPLGPIAERGLAPNRRGTTVRFHPDPDIFGADARFHAATLYRMARSKAYLFRGVEIRWGVDPAVLRPSDVPEQETLRFPGGLADHLADETTDLDLVGGQSFVGLTEVGDGRVEWAIAWSADAEGRLTSYCNTVPTPQGGTHETGLRTALLRSVKGFGELAGNKRAQQITAEDVAAGALALLSVFVPEPQFQGQTKERLVSAEAARLVEAAVKDNFDHWLSADAGRARAILDHFVERAEDRIRRRASREAERKTATRKLRLPGKLTDCARNTPDGTEVFLVEGDSAGGSAKQARDREFQAVLPLRGKILNVAAAGTDKLRQNQELKDLVLALGCGSGDRFDASRLRYERVIIMTDADVDGAHIAALLMTFFLREMPELVTRGHLFLAQPPLYRLAQGGTVAYARDDADRERLMATKFKGKGKVEISRFKGLGEMPPAQLRETTMAPGRRTLLRITLPDNPAAADSSTSALVERLMGRKPEHRFAFIQENAHFARELDV
jgi:topoisomerase-4 subunit B